MKIIEIKYKDTIKQVFIDDEDFDLINKYHWNYVKQGYAQGYKRPYNKNEKYVFMHRLIMGLERGNPIEIDHRDHNGLNNQRNNLRLGTHKQNCQNTSPQRYTSSAYRGVVKNRHRKMCKDGMHYYGTRYIAKIKFNGITKALGSYVDERVAAKIYDKVASLLFGEYANLNFKNTQL